MALGGGAQGAAAILGVNRKTISRALADYGLVKPRKSELSGEVSWQQAYEQHGQSARSLARAFGIRSHKYVLGQLERYGIKETPEGPCVGEQMRLAREPLIRDATGRYVRAEGPE
jgi:hypothetical protein